MGEIVNFQPKKQRYCILVGYENNGDPADVYVRADGSGGILCNISANSLDEIPELIKIAQIKAQQL